MVEKNTMIKKLCCALTLGLSLISVGVANAASVEDATQKLNT